LEKAVDLSELIFNGFLVGGGAGDGLGVAKTGIKKDKDKDRSYFRYGTVLNISRINGGIVWNCSVGHFNFPSLV
jgi:hypothetical protein